MQPLPGCCRILLESHLNSAWCCMVSPFLLCIMICKERGQLHVDCLNSFQSKVVIMKMASLFGQEEARAVGRTGPTSIQTQSPAGICRAGLNTIIASRSLFLKYRGKMTALRMPILRNLESFHFALNLGLIQLGVMVYARERNSNKNGFLDTLVFTDICDLYVVGQKTSPVCERSKVGGIKLGPIARQRLVLFSN